MVNMEDALKTLLHQIYAAPAPAPTASSNERSLSPDEFRMYLYKVIPCTRRGPHSWVECSFCHPGEKASRRDPQKFAYAPIACPDMKKEGRCARGDDCWFAHNIFEYWLHPARYRTQLCSYGVECKRSICFFAHDPRELRITEHLAQLQELENELEAQDPGFGQPNAKWPSSNQAAASATSKPGQQQRPLGNSRSLGPDTLQAAQFRHLQQAISSQANAQGLSPQAMLTALGGYLPTPGGMSAMPHASANAAAAALLEAALQPATPPMAAPLGMNASLSPCSSLLTPMTSMAPQRDDASVAATMKLLADITAGQAPGLGASAARLQPAASVPTPLGHHQEGSNSSSDIQQALHLIAQLQQLAAKATATAATGNSDLQSVLLSMLPPLLAQVRSGVQAQPAASVTSPAAHSMLQPSTLPLGGQLGGLLAPCGSAPVSVDTLSRQSPNGSGGGAVVGPPPSAAPPAVKAPTPRDSSSASPADVLSCHSRITAGSSCSSRLSDGTHSPTLSHHSDEGLRGLSAAGFPGLKEEHPTLAPSLLGIGAGAKRDSVVDQHGPFSLMSTALKADDLAAKLGAASAAPQLPASLEHEHDADLASGMAEMSGAAGMIASLSQLVDTPMPAEVTQQLQQLSVA